ncbi:hypothetical protein MVEN_02353300 [Mycena venus]|uniref:Uncharacterized protein n=1 Tax=Mycena venus TaxID=2733690 RepID=A0A8H6X3J5_9AGAR|nr:hypothetical protein MVEN_02353300 [Mycena venus]
MALLNASNFQDNGGFYRGSKRGGALNPTTGQGGITQYPTNPQYQMPPNPQYQPPPHPQYQPPNPQYQTPPNQYHVPPHPQYQAPPNPQYPPPNAQYPSYPQTPNLGRSYTPAGNLHGINDQNTRRGPQLTLSNAPAPNADTELSAQIQRLDVTDYQPRSSYNDPLPAPEYLRGARAPAPASPRALSNNPSRSLRSGSGSSTTSRQCSGTSSQPVPPAPAPVSPHTLSNNPSCSPRSGPGSSASSRQHSDTSSQTTPPAPAPVSSRALTNDTANSSLPTLQTDHTSSSTHQLSCSSSQALSQNHCKSTGEKCSIRLPEDTADSSAEREQFATEEAECVQRGEEHLVEKECIAIEEAALTKQKAQEEECLVEKEHMAAEEAALTKQKAEEEECLAEKEHIAVEEAALDKQKAVEEERARLEERDLKSNNVTYLDLIDQDADTSLRPVEEPQYVEGTDSDLESEKADTSPRQIKELQYFKSNDNITDSELLAKEADTSPRPVEVVEYKDNSNSDLESERADTSLSPYKDLQHVESNDSDLVDEETDTSPLADENLQRVKSNDNSTDFDLDSENAVTSSELRYVESNATAHVPDKSIHDSNFLIEQGLELQVAALAGRCDTELAPAIRVLCHGLENSVQDVSGASAALKGLIWVLEKHMTSRNQTVPVDIPDSEPTKDPEVLESPAPHIASAFLINLNRGTQSEESAFQKGFRMKDFNGRQLIAPLELCRCWTDLCTFLDIFLRGHDESRFISSQTFGVRVPNKVDLLSGERWDLWVRRCQDDPGNALAILDLYAIMNDDSDNCPRCRIPSPVKHQLSNPDNLRRCGNCQFTFLEVYRDHPDTSSSTAPNVPSTAQPSRLSYRARPQVDSVPEPRNTNTPGSELGAMSGTAPHSSAVQLSGPVPMNVQMIRRRKPVKSADSENEGASTEDDLPPVSTIAPAPTSKKHLKFLRTLYTLALFGLPGRYFNQAPPSQPLSGGKNGIRASRAVYKCWINEWSRMVTAAGTLFGLLFTVLQIPSAAYDPVVRTVVQLSMVCLFFGALYTVILLMSFGALNSEPQEGDDEMHIITDHCSKEGFWNPWVMLCMPLAWITWGVIYFMIFLLAFFWRSGAKNEPDDNTKPSLNQEYGPRIVMTITMTVGLVYLVLTIKTVKNRRPNHDTSVVLHAV